MSAVSNGARSFVIGLSRAVRCNVDSAYLLPTVLVRPGFGGGRLALLVRRRKLVVDIYNLGAGFNFVLLLIVEFASDMLSAEGIRSLMAVADGVHEVHEAHD